MPEAARHLGVCTKTVERWLRSGRLQGHRIGRWPYVQYPIPTDLVLRALGATPLPGILEEATA